MTRVHHANDGRHELFAHYGIGLEPTDEVVDLVLDLLARRVDLDQLTEAALESASDADREELAEALGIDPKLLDYRHNDIIIAGVLLKPLNALERQLGLLS